MREMLEPVFGESGAIVAQFFVILVFVLILTGVGYLMYRRYYGNAMLGSSRGRVPRLGIIDSLSIDHRRRLVLIRRDNVEHLLLIGNNSDLVVESAILRANPAGARARPQPPRQPAQPQARPQPQPPVQESERPSQPPPPQPRAPASSSVPSPEPPPAPSRPPVPQGTAPRAQAPSISEPIPFPQHRRPAPRPPQPAREPPAVPGNDRRAGAVAERSRANAPEAVAETAAVATAGGATAAAASAHFEEPARPTKIGPGLSRAEVHDVVAEELIADWEGRESARVDSAVAKVRAPEVRSDVANARDASEHRALDATSGQNAQRASASDQTAESSEDQAPPDEAERAAAVSNLEQEMARLLGQITTKSDS